MMNEAQSKGRSNFFIGVNTLALCLPLYMIADDLRYGGEFMDGLFAAMGLLLALFISLALASELARRLINHKSYSKILQAIGAFFFLCWAAPVSYFLLSLVIFS